MEFRQIMYFEAVSKYKSISKAAASLFVTQQCVSKQISLLEQELGTPLLIRNKTGVSLTDAGYWFQEHASMILQIEQDIEEHFTKKDERKANTLHIGVFHSLSPFYDESFFQSFRKNHPELTVQVSFMWAGQIEEMLEQDHLDIAISASPAQRESLHTRPLFREPFCCILNRNHPLAAHKSLSLKDIVHEKIAMADENHSSYQIFYEKCMELGVTPDVYTAPDLLSIYSYVLNHNAVGFSLSSFASHFDVDQICCIPHDDPFASWEICMLTKRQDQQKYRPLASELSRCSLRE